MRGSYLAVECDTHSIQIPRSVCCFIDIEAGVDNGTGLDSESNEWDCGSLLFSGVGYCFSWTQIQTTLLMTGTLIRACMSHGRIFLIRRRDWANFRCVSAILKPYSLACYFPE